MKDLNLTTITSKLALLLHTLRRYAVITFIVAVVGLYGFLVFSIGRLAQSEPSEEVVTDKLQTVKRPKLDQASVNQLEQLQAENIQVESLFKQARNNPFQD